jgi:DNA polymerase
MTWTAEQAEHDSWAYTRMTTLEQQYQSCALCPGLVETSWWSRTSVVFGEGTCNADILIVGIGPGEDEDLTGVPFYGRTGKLLDEMLLNLCPYSDLAAFNKKELNEDEWRKVREELTRIERIYYTNAILCRPTHQDYDERDGVMKVKNRDPLPGEVSNCRDRLRRTIYITDPYLIISLGAPTLAALLALETRSSMSKKKMNMTDHIGEIVDLSIRGEITDLRYPVMVLPHPAFLLRSWDIRSPTGYVKQTMRGLQRGLQLVDAIRHETRDTPIPERKI